MAIDVALFQKCWVKQVGPNCGSCCVASIVNYIRYKQEVNRIAAVVGMKHNDPWAAGLAPQRILATQPPLLEDNSLTVGLAVDGVVGLGSVTAKLAQWVAQTQGPLCAVTQVKVQGLRLHWGGLNPLAGGDSHRPTIPANAAYFSKQGRFLLRECSTGITGHFIIQTDVDEFWDPNVKPERNPQTLARRQSTYSPWGLNLRADACQFDVA